MAKQLYSNNATSKLLSGIDAVATSLTLTTGGGAKFSSPTGGNWETVTLVGDEIYEIVTVTSRTGDVLTVVRGSEGTTALSWAADTTVEARLTAGALSKYPQDQGTGTYALALCSADGSVAAPGWAAVAIGQNAQANVEGGVAIGWNSTENALYAVAIGYQSAASGHASIAIGRGITAAGTYGVAIGDEAQATRLWTLGIHGVASGDNSLAIGRASLAAVQSGVAIGERAVSNGFRAVAIGSTSRAANYKGVALGNMATAYAYSSFAGPQAEVYADESWTFNAHPTLQRVNWWYPHDETSRTTGAEGVISGNYMDLGGVPVHQISHVYKDGDVVKPTIANGKQYLLWVDYQPDTAVNQITSHSVAPTWPMDDGDSVEADDPNVGDHWWICVDMSLGVNAALPAHTLFFPTEVGFICFNYNGVTTPPVVSFGSTAAPTSLINNQPLSQITGSMQWHRFTSLPNIGISGGIKFKLDTPAGGTDSQFHGRFYLKGVFISTQE